VSLIVFVHVELTTGEGLILRHDVPDGFPVHHRWYKPFTEDNDPDAYAKNLEDNLLEHPGAKPFLDSSQESIISIQCIPALKSVSEVVGLKVSEAYPVAAEMGLEIKVIMEDGKPTHVDPKTLDHKRVFVWTNAGTIYRSEVLDAT